MTTCAEYENVFKEEIEAVADAEDFLLECAECDLMWPNTGSLSVPLVLEVTCLECFGIPGAKGFLVDEGKVLK